MLLHVPGKHPDALEVDVRIVARSSFSNDVPVDLAGDRVLNSIERLHRSVRVFLAVLRNVGGNIEFECVCENPADFGWLWPHFEPDVMGRLFAGAGQCNAFQNLHFRSRIEPVDD